MQLTSPKNEFSNDDLVELEWVFASICDALEAEQGKLSDQVKSSIRRRLFFTFNGMTDPRSLRDHIVRSFTKEARAAQETPRDPVQCWAFELWGVATMGDFLKHETLVVAPGVLVAILTLVHVWLQTDQVAGLRRRALASAGALFGVRNEMAAADQPPS